MSAGEKKKLRQKKARGRKIIKERRAQIEKKSSGKRLPKITVPKEKTILFLFLGAIALVPLVFLLPLAVNKIEKANNRSPKEQAAKSAAKSAVKEELKLLLPGAFWLSEKRGELVRLEKTEVEKKTIISTAYLNKQAREASANNPSSFTYLLRNENINNPAAARDLFQKNALATWKRRHLLFFVSREKPWKQFYLLDEKRGRAALLLDASGEGDWQSARELFTRVETLE